MKFNHGAGQVYANFANSIPGRAALPRRHCIQRKDAKTRSRNVEPRTTRTSRKLHPLRACSSLAGAGEDVRRTGEGCRVKTNFCGAGRGEVIPILAKPN